MKSKNLMMIAVLIFVSGSIFAQGNTNRPCNPNGQGINNSGGGFMNIPDLTEDQKTKMTDLRTAHMKEMLPVKNELNEKRARLNTLKTAEKVDMNALNQLLDEMGAMKTDIAKKREKHHQEIRQILTADQRVVFDMHAGNRGNMHMKHKGNCNGKGMR